MSKCISLVIVVLALAAVPLAGHHSFAAIYLEDDLLQADGTVVEFQFKNPHAWVFVDGQEGLQKPKVYAAEWAGTSRLERDGITAKTLRQGDRVRIWFSPNRNPSDNRVHLKRIERSDGWTWAGRQRSR